MNADELARALRRQLAIVRDRNGDPLGRSLAGATLGALVAGTLDSETRARFPDDPAARMFAYGARHADAPLWDGRTTRSGTITYVDAERIEQYVGASRWVAYRQADLHDPGFVVGDQVRIGPRGDGVHIEAVGNNRLGSRIVADASRLRSGLVVARTVPLDENEWNAMLQTTADRYGASIGDHPGGAALRWNRDIDLRFAFVPLDVLGEAGRQLSAPPTAALRIEAGMGAADAAGASVVERALVFAAAFAAGGPGEATVRDDTGALLDAGALHDLALADATRADAFAIAAAAAGVLRGDGPRWFSPRAGRCDELSVLGSRSWRSDLGRAFLRRAFVQLGAARERTEDPIIPAGAIEHPEPAGDRPALTPLFTLAYERAALRIALVDIARAPDCADAEALIGSPVATIVSFGFGNSTDDTSSAAFVRDMQRANTLATLLAAGIAARIDGIAVAPDGRAFDATSLGELVLRRSGTYAIV